MGKFNNILSQIGQLQPVFITGEIDLKDAFNRILQEDVFADADMPPFHKSAMDGYACRLEDLENELEILETIPAGSLATVPVGKNQCVKIMTGAAVPENCDCVFKVEESVLIAENRVRCNNPKTSKNICYQGEDYHSGETLIKKGTVINVSQMAVMAGAGKTKVKVTVKPKISLIATGSELVEPDRKPETGKIRNSNASQVIAQLQKMNLEVNYLGLVSDDFEELSKKLADAFLTGDIVIFTGGASVGDFDFIPEILRKEGFTVHWDRTGIKPGNPMTFAEKSGKFCFGLSGNPVSSLVQFEFLVKPVLYKLLGANEMPFRIKAPIGFDYKQRSSDRLNIKPVIIDSDGNVKPIPFNGSAHINSLVFANALMEIPEETSEIKKGDLVYVRPL